MLKLQQEIGPVTNAHKSNYAKGNDIVANLNAQELKKIDTTQITNDVVKYGATQQQTALTDAKQMQIQALQERDQEFDNQMDVIGNGLNDLMGIPQKQGEEVKRQGAMLNSLGKKIESLNDKVENINYKMKDTLEQVGRGSGKLFVDIGYIMREGRRYC